MEFLFTSYSPDFNPIEEAFSKVKSGLKSQLDSSSDVETLLASQVLAQKIVVAGLNIQVYTTSIDFVNTLIFHIFKLFAITNSNMLTQ